MSARVERTIEALLSGGFTATAKCTVCRRHREIDLRTMLDTLGRNYSLWNRRAPCSLKPLCPGWVHFHIGPGFGHVAADERTQMHWASIESHEERLWREGMDAAEKNGGLLLVCQSDRDAAASYLFNEGQAGVSRLMTERKLDNHLLVQAFARRALLARIRRLRSDG